MRWKRMGTLEVYLKAPSDFSPEEEPRYQLRMRLGGSKGRSGLGREQKNPSPVAGQTAATQVVANHFKN